jgi:alpha-glucosidase
VPQEHFSHAVGLQEVDPQSTLNRYRHFLKWRKTQSALCNGGMSMLPAHDQAVAFLRHGLDGTVVCVFNLSPLPTKYEIAMDGSLIPLEGHGFNSTVEGLTISLPPHEAFFGYLVAQPVGTSGADSVERNTPCLEYNSAK